MSLSGPQSRGPPGQVPHRFRMWDGRTLKNAPHEFDGDPGHVGAGLAAGPAHAAIFQWEYLDPGDPSLGKQRSTTLCPDGAGLFGAPGEDLSFKNLTKAHLPSAVLWNAKFNGTNLHDANLQFADCLWADFTNADLSDADLRYVQFRIATLTDANFGGADIRGASFAAEVSGYIETGTVITLSQLIATGSSQQKDLSDIGVKLVVRDVPNFLLPNVHGWLSPVFLHTDDIQLGGALELSFEPGVDLAAQLGQTFDIFNWNDRLTGAAGRSTWSARTSGTWPTCTRVGRSRWSASPNPPGR